MQLDETFGRLRALPNVWGCYLGFKSVSGRSTGEPAIVCVVNKKVAPSRLSGDALVPASHEWSIGRRRKARLATDVIQASPRFRAQAGEPPVAGPGDIIVRANGVTGTVGLAVRRGSTTFVTTAGHVFADAQAGEIATLRNAGGAAVQTPVRLVETRTTVRADCALLVTSAVAQNLYFDRIQITGVHMPNSVEDLGKPLFVAKASGTQAVRCRGLRGVFTLPNGAVIERVILTDFSTQAGDSGCPLVDPEGRIWGLLRGGLFSNTNPVSIFATAIDLLFEMQVELS